MLPLAILERKTDMPVLCNNAPKMVGLPVVLLWKLAALVMFHHPCFTALNPLGYQAQLPANFEMNVVVSLTGVVMCSSSEEAVWTGLPGPWVDLSTFLKLALVPLAVLIWQLASLFVCQLPFPSLLSHAHCRNNACFVCISVSSFGPARPPHDDHSLVSTSIRMRSHGIFSQCACVFHHPNPHAQSRIFLQCACVFHHRMDVACVHTRTRSHSS